MAVDDVLNKLENIVTHEGASSKAIADMEKSIGAVFPMLYSELIRRTNGVEGFLSQVNYVQIWSISQLVELNKNYDIRQSAPGLLLFGSNGGDAGYAFDLRSDAMPVVEVPFIGLSLQTATLVGTSFESFLENMCANK